MSQTAIVFQNGTSPKVSQDVDLEAIANSEDCSGFTGADLAALVREAGVLALRDLIQGQNMSGIAMVTSEHFRKAFSKIRPSVPEKVMIFNWLMDFLLFIKYFYFRTGNIMKN